MSKFSYFQPTEICFGAGRIKEVGEVVRGYGKRCLLVTGSNVPSVEPMFTSLMDALYAAGIIVAHFEYLILLLTSLVMGLKWPRLMERMLFWEWEEVPAWTRPRRSP